MTNLAGSLDTALTLKNPWAVVPSLGHLDAYISAVNRMPMLTLEQEQEFARKLKNENDLEAARDHAPRRQRRRQDDHRREAGLALARRRQDLQQANSTSSNQWT